MNTDAIVDNSLSYILATVTQSLVDATKQYGPDVVELGLFVYRIEAIQQLLIALVVSVALIIFWKMWLKWAKTCKDWGEPDQVFPRGVAGVLLATATVPLVVQISFDLLNPFYWAAALGSPEVLVAYKALAAADLM